MNNASSPSPLDDPGFCIGPWRVEPLRNAIFRDDEERHLENRVMRTLVLLAEHQDQVVTREHFSHSIWQGCVVNEAAL
jgi:DNA-binding winged helix-turn-helix (wHTH) protein